MTCSGRCRATYNTNDHADGKDDYLDHFNSASCVPIAKSSRSNSDLIVTSSKRVDTAVLLQQWYGTELKFLLEYFGTIWNNRRTYFYYTL